MALDWGKQFSFSGMRKRVPKAKADFPSKNYINLAPKDQNAVDVRKFVPWAIVILLAAALIVRFGVLDFYERVAQKQMELAEQTQILSGLETQLADFDQVKAEYDLYESSRIVANSAAVSAIDALDLVDTYVAPAASIASIQLQGNTISLNLVDISLDGVGELVSKLYEQPMVANVSVSTAANANSAERNTTATMVITLQHPETTQDAQQATQGTQG